MSEGNEIFSVISNVVQRFGQSDYGLPAQKKIAETEKLIGFCLFDMEYVVSLSDISEVLEVPKCTKLPRVKPWVLGVANVRGRLLPIIDFAKFLGRQHSGATNAHRVLVFDIAGTYLGIIVDQVLGIKALSVDSYQPASETGALGSFIDGRFVVHDQTYELFRPQRLMEDSEFMNVSV